MKTNSRSSDKKRLFLGILPPDYFLESIALFRQKNTSLRNMRWVAARNLHITCLFIGSTYLHEEETLKNTISSVLSKTSQFELEFDKFINVKRDKTSGMIWLKLKQDDLFSRLSRELSIHLLKKDLNKDPIPHMTLARYKHAGTIDLNQKIHFDSKILPVNEIILFESTLKESGAEYAALKSWVL